MKKIEMSLVIECDDDYDPGETADVHSEEHDSALAQMLSEAIDEVVSGEEQIVSFSLEMVRTTRSEDE